MYDGKWDYGDGPVTGEDFDKLTTEIADNTIERAFHSDPIVRRLNRTYIATILRDYK